jgi:transglutaminase-like putative cysteine protease
MGVLKIRGAVLAAAWLAVGCIASTPSAAQSLFVIPTDSPPPASPVVADDQPLHVALHVRDATALAKVLGVTRTKTETGVLDYVMSDYPAIQVTTPRDWNEPSFVIDYHEPSVVRLSAEFAKTAPRQSVPDRAYVAALKAFVAANVHESYDRGFDIASEVAVRREGNCKQFAVLTVALARSYGIPARVVFGLALLRKESRYAAFGHAWAELQLDGEWLVADATLASLEMPVRYLPFGVLENEGMGYTVDIARLTSVWVQRVEVLGGATADRGVSTGK